MYLKDYNNLFFSYRFPDTVRTQKFKFANYNKSLHTIIQTQCANFTVPLLPIFRNGPPPPDKDDNSRFVHFCNPLQLISPDHDHAEGQTRHVHLFSGQILEKIAHVLNLFPPTFASTKHSHVTWDITEIRHLARLHLPGGVLFFC